MRTITNNTKEIHTPADLKGMKIRVQSDPIQMATFEALGASTMNVSFSELFTSLQQGLCDGQDNPVITNVSRKFYECQKYMTLLNHMIRAPRARPQPQPLSSDSALQDRKTKLPPASATSQTL